MSRPPLSDGKRGTRTFHLRVEPEGDAFGIALLETNERDHTTDLVARANPRRTTELAHPIQRALAKSGHARTTLTPRRNTPISLIEDEGVRLALAMIATDPIRKGRRKTHLLDAVDTMATEETYYWYAKCTRHPRAQRALRLLLAEE